MAEVLDRPLKTDVAILAALAVLEGGEGPTTTRGQPDKDLLRAAYNWRKPWTFDTLKAEAEADVRRHRKDFDLLPSGERERLVGERQGELWQEGKSYCWALLLKRTETKLRTSRKKFNELPDKRQRELTKEHARRILDESELLLELAEAELRFYRGDFEKLSYEDQKNLIVGNAERISMVAAAAHKHAEYLERWRVEKTTTKAREYVRAAELKDIEGLKDPEIAQRLGIEQAPTEKSEGRSDNANVRRATKEGRKILNILYGGGWTEYAKQQRSKFQR